MALQEPNTIIASSQDNFLVFNNSEYQIPPYVTFTSGGSNFTGDMVITDAQDEDGFKTTINFAPQLPINAVSFPTAGSTVQMMFALMECLKMSSIFFDITQDTDEAGNNTIRCNIDTSRRYRFTVTAGTFTISGNYDSVNLTGNNKFVLMMSVDSGTTSLTMEKYNNNATVSFNVSSPFSYITELYPFSVNLLAYSVFNNITTPQPINNSKLFIMPTTLSKFEKIDYDAYFKSLADPEKKELLTTLTVRQYNYGEYIGLSFLTDSTEVTLKKKYYTNSGVFLTAQTSYLYREITGYRHDWYDTFDLANVEANFNRQVGYVEVMAVDAATGEELSYPVRYNIKPKCNGNCEIFFVNKTGGIDSFNFTGVAGISGEAKNSVTYLKNPVGNFLKIQALEYVKQKRNEIKFSNVSSLIDNDTALWLNELAASKFAYRFMANNGELTSPRFKTIIIDKLSVEVTSDETQSEVTIEFHDSDNTINI
jgi:hypothetical protein